MRKAVALELFEGNIRYFISSFRRRASNGGRFHQRVKRGTARALGVTTSRPLNFYSDRKKLQQACSTLLRSSSSITLRVPVIGISVGDIVAFGGGFKKLESDS